MYSNLPNLILAFHGCDEKTYKKVLHKNETLLPSLIGLGMEFIFWKTVYQGQKNGRYRTVIEIIRNIRIVS